MVLEIKFIQIKRIKGLQYFFFPFQLLQYLSHFSESVVMYIFQEPCLSPGDGWSRLQTPIDPEQVYDTNAWMDSLEQRLKI